jgi:asparagine synthetase B (glutamine-hydrolysing)
LEHEDARATEWGLEFRFPYLSWSLLALVLSVPPGLRPPAQADRSLQRLALRGVLPERIRTRDTFLNFNESIMLNTEAAAEQIESLLVCGPWMSEGLVDRRKAQDEFFELSRSAGTPYSAERGQGWRRIRDVAALEAWLRRL